MLPTMVEFAIALSLLAGSAGMPVNESACVARDWDAGTRRAWLAQAEGEADAALALVTCLDEADPGLRDEFALGGLTTWLRGGKVDVATRGELARRLLVLLEGAPDEAGFRRPFAAMALAEVARAERLDPRLSAEELQSLVVIADRYLRSIRDYRAWDAREGWRHAVAHGADLVLQLGLHPGIDGGTQARLLDALATCIAPLDGPAYTHGEAERFARAVHHLHARGLVPAEAQRSWLRQLHASASPGESAGISAGKLAWRHNLWSFLQALGYAARSSGQTDRAREIDELIGELPGP